MGKYSREFSTEHPASTLNASILENFGLAKKTTELQVKYNRLYKFWNQNAFRRNSAIGRAVCDDILHTPNCPTKLVILSDEPKAFQAALSINNGQNNQDIKADWLLLACLFGAEKVAEHLLSCKDNNLKHEGNSANYVPDIHSQYFTAAASSCNTKLMSLIAKHFKLDAYPDVDARFMPLIVSNKIGQVNDALLKNRTEHHPSPPRSGTAPCAR